uniref:Uncharacterized protein n=1 Tax=Romanomermis culicivorax TaxID=13658 RepID=A0A915KY22_ROMCU
MIPVLNHLDSQVLILDQYSISDIMGKKFDFRCSTDTIHGKGEVSKNEVQPSTMSYFRTPEQPSPASYRGR